MQFIIRKAVLHDCQVIEELIKLSARGLSTNDYTPDQVEDALQGAFGVDTQLIKDGTYFVVEDEGRLFSAEIRKVRATRRNSTPKSIPPRYARSSFIPIG